MQQPLVPQRPLQEGLHLHRTEIEYGGVEVFVRLAVQLGDSLGR